jgi:hypothetical protein
MGDPVGCATAHWTNNIVNNDPTNIERSKAARMDCLSQQRFVEIDHYRYNGD